MKIFHKHFATLTPTSALHQYKLNFKFFPVFNLWLQRHTFGWVCVCVCRPHSLWSGPPRRNGSPQRTPSGIWGWVRNFYFSISAHSRAAHVQFMTWISLMYWRCRSASAPAQASSVDCRNLRVNFARHFYYYYSLQHWIDFDVKIKSIGNCFGWCSKRWRRNCGEVRWDVLICNLMSALEAFKFGGGLHNLFQIDRHARVVGVEYSRN